MDVSTRVVISTLRSGTFVLPYERQSANGFAKEKAPIQRGCSRINHITNWYPRHVSDILALRTIGVLRLARASILPKRGLPYRQVIQARVQTQSDFTASGSNLLMRVCYSLIA